jgi:uncharacterized protein YkwD
LESQNYLKLSDAEKELLNMNTTQEVTTKTPTNLTVSDRVSNETVLKSDVMIPKILLMQGLSELVAERKAMMGDIIRSTTGEKIGDDTLPVEIIPLTFTNSWVLSEKIGTKYEFRGIEPRTAANETAAWDFIKNGVEWKRTQAIDVFALLPADIAAETAELTRAETTGEMPDFNKTLLPVVIRFQNTSFRAGRHVVTHFTKAMSPSMAKFGVKPYSYSLILKCYQDKNDKGTFYVWDVSQGQKVSKETLELAAQWYQTVATKAVRVDESYEQAALDKAAEAKANKHRLKETSMY